MTALWRSATCFVLLGVLAFVVACAPSAQPSPAAAPAKPAEAAKPGAGTKPLAGRTVRVATWGGDMGNGVKNSVGKLLEEQTGATAEYVFGNPADNLTKILSMRGEPPFDVMMMDQLTEATMIEKDLLEKVDHARLPINELFPEAVVTKEYGPAYTILPVVIAWVPARFKELGLAAPRSFDDLFDPKLKGRVAFPGIRVGTSPLTISGLAYAWAGDKGAVGQAMKKLKELNPRVFGATPEMANWLTNGEVYAAVTQSAQVYTMQQQGFELGFVYPQIKDKRGMVYWNETNIIKGTRNKDVAEAWLAASLSAEGQDRIGRLIGILPTNKAVAEKFSKDEKLKTLALAPGDMAQMFQVDSKFILDNREKWNDEWDRIMGS